MALLNEVADKYFEKLDMFTVAITRAHGKNHPEAFEVRELFSEIKEKIQIAGSTKPNLDAELTQLREVTNNYTIPGDVCGTYAAVYNMLSETDQAYQA
ncbi:iron-sulfur cluster repair di-iron protein, ric [Carnobacterium sp. CS13]|uniref:iron-sulfur cluster repair di-iron protein, ric n=1 Tax=Carnobacterium sp. CS13 TaxID=2800128 RepID=UPI0019138365|nr:iron-sulfur cluster repair di-iron protein, ric [Carnobacterium sp. CS13]QQP70088.1 iron-sulfur cluster repair di-iron protein, ric [Carnobacterium sp. CS13]